MIEKKNDAPETKTENTEANNKETGGEASLETQKDLKDEGEKESFDDENSESSEIEDTEENKEESDGKLEQDNSKLEDSVNPNEGNAVQETKEKANLSSKLKDFGNKIKSVYESFAQKAGYMTNQGFGFKLIGTAVTAFIGAIAHVPPDVSRQNTAAFDTIARTYDMKKAMNRLDDTADVSPEPVSQEVEDETLNTMNEGETSESISENLETDDGTSSDDTEKK